MREWTLPFSHRIKKKDNLERRDFSVRAQLFNILKKCTATDLELLHHLYLYRCLSFQQAKDFIYKRQEQSIDDFFSEYIQPLLTLGVVEQVEYTPNQFVLFLTTNGVDIVREVRDIPLEIFNPDTKIVKRGYYRAGELKMNIRLIQHQVYLNQFFLEFQELAKERNIKWKYYDEKYVSQYLTIRPDGLIQLLDTDFFIEMDLGTESKKQLQEKWNHYREFVRSSEFTNRERKIVILFITEHTKNKEKRKELVRFTAANQILDLFRESFDLFIGSKEEILHLLFRRIIPNILQSDAKKQHIVHFLQQKQFRVDFAHPLHEALNKGDYEFYIRKINNNKNIITENERLQEYVLDDYTHQALSVLQRMVHHKRNAQVFKLKFGRVIPYIVVVRSPKSIYQDLKLLDSFNLEGVYLTTMKRLKELPFHKALFRLDETGNLYHFDNSGLQKQILEKNIWDVSLKTSMNIDSQS